MGQCAFRDLEFKEKTLNKRLDELKTERASTAAGLFIARCAISLLTVLLVVQFVFEKPITLALIAFCVVLIPAVLFCYDKLVTKFSNSRK